MPHLESRKKPALTRLALSLVAPIVALWTVADRHAQAWMKARTSRLGNMLFIDSNVFSGVLGKVLTLIVVFAILGGVAVSFFSNLKTLVTAFNNTSATGNTTVDGFIAIFGLIVAILGVFALVKLVQHASDN